MKSNFFKVSQIRKIFEKNIKKFFIKESPNYPNCLYCGKKLKGSQRKYCSTKCNTYFHRYGTNNLNNVGG